MAKATQVGVKVLRTQNIKPAKIRRVEKFMGRSAPVTDEAVISLAESLRTRGQEQPVQVRPIDGTDEFEVIFGNTRSRAGELIAGGYKLGDKEIAANPEFTLRCEVVECSDEDAFINNLVEQAHRNQCTPIDNAKNHQRLRDEHEMSDAAITKLYGYGHQASVTKLKKLLTLPENIQQSIHNGDMSASAGFFLADCKDVAEKNAWDVVWAKIKANGDESFAIGVTQVVTAVKEWRTEQKEAATQTTATEGTSTPNQGEGTATPTTGETSTPTNTAVALTLKQFKDNVVKGYLESKRTPPKLRKCLELLSAVIAGTQDAVVWAKFMLQELGEDFLPEAPVVEPMPADAVAAQAAEATGETATPEATPETNGKGKTSRKGKVTRK